MKRKTKPGALAAALWLLLGPAAARGHDGQAPRAPDLSSYVGIYQGEGPHQVLVVSPRQIGERKVLVFTDLGTDEIRVLFPDRGPSFVAGETILQRDPVQYRLRFQPGAGDRPAKLEIEDAATGTTWGAHALPRRVEAVSFAGKDGVMLRGLLHLPTAAGGPFPAVILAGGSELEGNRDEFDALPYLLASRGVAVLAFDKRGTGSSGGSWDVPHEVLAADLVAGLELLAGHKEVAAPLGVIGFSEGSWIAPLAASRTQLVDFIVALSGGALPKSESFLHKNREELMEQGLEGEALEKAFAEKRTFIEEAVARAREDKAPTAFDRRMAHDPSVQWKRFRGAVLFVMGGCDTLVPPQRSADRMRAILTDVHHPDFTIRVFPLGHHSLFLGESCKPSEFAGMQDIRRFVPGYWQLLLSWIRQHASPATASLVSAGGQGRAGSVPGARPRR